MTVNSIGMKLVLIPAGEFDMGSPASEPGHVANEGPVHRVRITRAFEMGVHEVTNQQFRAFAEALAYETDAQRDVDGGFGIDFDRAEVIRDPHTDWRNPGFPGFLPGPDHPVLMVSWQDAEAFCKWLSEKEGRAYRLPTEAEWDTRRGRGRRRPGGPARPDRAGDRRKHGGRGASLEGAAGGVVGGLGQRPRAFPRAVRVLQGERRGLLDMHGDVREWCLDWHGAAPLEVKGSRPRRGPRPQLPASICVAGSISAKQNHSAQRIYFQATFRYCLCSGVRVVGERP